MDKGLLLSLKLCFSSKTYLNLPSAYSEEVFTPNLPSERGQRFTLPCIIVFLQPDGDICSVFSFYRYR